MGQLQRQQSFGELSALLQQPFTCTVVAGADVEAAVIQDTDLHSKHAVCSSLWPPLFVEHLTGEDTVHGQVRMGAPCSSQTQPVLLHILTVVMVLLQKILELFKSPI